MNVGYTATSTRTLTQVDFDTFAGLSGDDNPIHVDPAFAITTRFGATVAHGMLLYACVDAAISDLAADAMVLEQQLRFPAPAFTDERITIRLEVTAVGDGRATVATAATKPDGSLALDGEALLALDVSGHHGLPSLPGLPLRNAAAFTGPAPSGSWWDSAIGRRATVTRSFGDADLAAYARLAGAAPAGEKVPGPLLAGMVSMLLGTTLPGPGTNYLKQRWRYLSPSPTDAPLTASVEISRVRPDKHLVDLETDITGTDGATHAQGRALVLVRDATAVQAAARPGPSSPGGEVFNPSPGAVFASRDGSKDRS